MSDTENDDDPAYDSDGKFLWSAEDVEIIPSINTERFILSAAALEGIEKTNSDIIYFTKKGLLTDKYKLTKTGEARLVELLELADKQDDERYILSLASVQGLEDAGPGVKTLISKGLINKDLSITTNGQRRLAQLSGLELLDKKP